MKTRLLFAATLLGTSTAALAQSSMSPNAAPPPPPARVAAQPSKAAADMQAVLDQLPRLGAKPIETLTPVKARIQPSAADAARAVMHQKGMSTAPDPAVTTRDVPYGSDPMQHARIYKPANATGASMPVVVYYHGGGWVIADVNTYHAAVVTAGATPHVFQVANGKAKAVPVAIRQSSDKGDVVAGGLDAHLPLIVDGAYQVSDGDTVRIGK